MIAPVADKKKLKRMFSWTDEGTTANKNSKYFGTSGLSRDDGKKPDGMTLILWSHGKAILWDSTLGNTLANSYLYLSSKNAGSVAEAAERRKYNHYRQLQNDYHFTPVSFETLGCMGPDTESFLNRLGMLMKKETGEPRSLDFLLQKFQFQYNVEMLHAFLELSVIVYYIGCCEKSNTAWNSTASKYIKTIMSHNFGIR